MISKTAPIGLMALCVSASLAAQEPINVKGTVKEAATGRGATGPVGPLSESVSLSQKAPAGVTAPKDCLDPWYGTLELKKKKLPIVVGKTKADGELPDSICADLNGNGKFEDNERVAIEVTSREGQGNQPKMATGKPVDVKFSFDGASFDTKIIFQRAGELSPGLRVVFPSYLEATAKIGDVERTVAILDKDHDGKYGSAGDLWLLAKSDDKPAAATAMNALDERRFDSGKLVGIKVEGTDIKLTTETATGPDPKAAAGQRHRVEKEWFDRFDNDPTRDQFISSKKVDLTRPKATKEIAWNYVTFDEGLALAKKSNKPLFVDCLAFWCVWCYRMDWTTYCDKEVAALLNDKFVPVKIIQEQNSDYTPTFDRLKEKGARGIPAMGIFNTEGKIVHFIGGWKNAQDFVKDLNTGLEGAGGAAVKDASAGKENKENKEKK